ncbi:glycine--tRNA ligase [Methanomassiliicoccales archaeon RumEn M1]|jgi:glycyl-tRNA synthetase|nr:glycine--tRNA ligase [Methanomassiliicoccales archaeon RumEn M1]
MADAQDVLSLCKRRGFLYPSFEIYGGVAGMYDYGPLGTALKNNIIEIWRRLYTLGEGFVEIDSETIGPEMVFKASGHVDEFADKMVKCKACEEPYRADHLVKDLHPNAGALGEKEIDDLIRKNNVVCPACGGELSTVEEFNLMFKTTIGPGSGRVGYMRPETAQGIFVNFPNLYRYNREKLPLGVIQVGRGYRNEISPRQGIIRLREFNMMECELFVDPADKTWPRFADVSSEMLRLVANDGREMEITVGDAVEQGVICNQVLAYFMWFTQEFLKAVGVDGERLRFRQHERDEMAHYAADCWDAESLLSYGWTEIVGIADRGCWDLSRHAQFSGVEMSSFKRFDEPQEIERDRIKPRYDKLGPMYKAKAGKIGKAMEEADPSAIHDGAIAVEVDGESIVIPGDLFEVARVKEKVSGVRSVPHVIEPSHGLDRIIYTVLEHAYSQKEDQTVMRLSAAVAPIKVGVFPLMARDELDEMAMELDQELRYGGIETYYDDSGSIGRRYARMDEIGTPFCITVDYRTREDGTVTLRERDTTNQVRIKFAEVLDVVRAALCGADLTQYIVEE